MPGESRSRPVVSRRVKRLVLSPLALLVASLCSACLATPDPNPDDSRQAGENRPSSTPSTGGEASPTSTPSPGGENRPTSTPWTADGQPERKTLAFGRSHTWDDGLTVTVGKPKNFKPSKWAVVKESKRYVRFDITVVNKSDKRIDIGLTAISLESRNKEEDELFDSVSGLKGPPDTEISKGQKSEFDVGFGVADPKDLLMEVTLHDKSARPTLRYST